MSSSSAMAARIQILHGGYPSSGFGLKEGELYVNNSGELYFGTSNSSSAMVFGSKFSEIEDSIALLDNTVSSLNTEITSLSSAVNSLNTSVASLSTTVTDLNDMITGAIVNIGLDSSLQGLIFEGQEIKPEHFIIAQNSSSIQNIHLYFNYSTYPQDDTLILDGLWSGTKDSKNYSGRFNVSIGRTTVGSFADEIANNPARVPYIAQYGDPSKFWKIGDHYDIPLFQTAGEIPLSIPITILDFNHDIVADPQVYGKEKAGMTLSIGGTRKVKTREPEEPSILTANDWYKLLNSIMSDYLINISADSNPNYTFKRPTKKLDNTPAKWKDSPIRTLFERNLLYDLGIQNITPIEVKKENTNRWQYGQFYTNSYETIDTYFLPSEQEIFGSERFTQMTFVPKIEIEPLQQSNSVFNTNSNGSLSTAFRSTTDSLPALKVADSNKLLSLLDSWFIAKPSAKSAVDNFGFIYIKKFSAGSKWHIYYPTITSLGIFSGTGDSGDYNNLTLEDLGLSTEDMIDSYDYVYIIHFINSALAVKNAFKISGGLEGNQYEFFRSKGTSKFFWSDDNLSYDNQSWIRKESITNILLRSTATRTSAQSVVGVGIKNSCPSSSDVSYNLTSIRSDIEQQTIFPCFCL